MSHISGTWKDLIIPVVGLGISSATPSPKAFLTLLSSYGFAQEDYLFGCFELQHDYIEGSNISPHVHWAPSSTNAGNVIWHLDYSFAPVNGVFGATTRISVTQAGSGVENTHQLAAFPDISGAARKVGCIMPFRLSRGSAADGDTYTAVAIALNIGVHYKCDSMGSTQLYTKN